MRGKKSSNRTILIKHKWKKKKKDLVAELYLYQKLGVGNTQPSSWRTSALVEKLGKKKKNEKEIYSRAMSKMYLDGRLFSWTSLSASCSQT